MLLPLAGLLLAMGMHALWNGSSTFGEYGFFAVYAAFMVPAFGLLTWLVIWTRQRELRTVRAELPAYAAAGWLTPAEPYALGSMRARRVAREYAAHHSGGGGPGGRGVRGVRDVPGVPAPPGRRGRAGADFAVREQELLHELWRRREWPGRRWRTRRGTGRAGYGAAARVPWTVRRYGRPTRSGGLRMAPHSAYNPYRYSGPRASSGVRRRGRGRPACGGPA